VGRADAIAEHKRETAGGGLVHDHSPWLTGGEEREDVRSRVELGDPLPGPVARQSQAGTALARQPFEPRALGPIAGDDEEQARIGRCRDSLDEVVHPLLGSEPADAQDDDVVRGRAELLAQPPPVRSETV
jgi:hypothetical protein